MYLFGKNKIKINYLYSKISQINVYLGFFIFIWRIMSLKIGQMKPVNIIDMFHLIIQWPKAL